MRTLLICAMTLLPFSAMSGHLDVIGFQMKDGCSVEQYLQAVRDFNENWGKDNGYHAEVVQPLQNDDLLTWYWLGRSADAQAFGKAWEQWVSDLENPDSVASGLWARFQECEDNVSRSSYIVHE